MAKKKTYNIDAGTGQSIADLLNKTYGDRPLQYEGVFKNAYENLGQQYNPTTQNGPIGIGSTGGAVFQKPGEPSGQQNVAVTGTKELADAFINRYYQRFGALPDEGTIKDFVGQNLNSRFASQYITGLPREQLTANVVDPYLQANKDDIAPEGTDTGATPEQTLQGQLDRYYGQARAGLASQVEDAYGPTKQKMVDELGAAGLTSSPVSRYSLNQLEGEKQKALTQAYGKLAESQAQGQLGIADTGAKLSENARQFDQNYLLNKQNMNEDIYRYDQGIGLQRQQMDLARQLGRQQGEDSQSGLGGDIFSGAASGAAAGTAIHPGIGTAIGAGLGAILGGATSKRKKF